MTVQDVPVTGTRRKKRSGEPQPYDFRRPMTLAREHGRVLEMAFETFARQWATQLTARLRVLAQVGLESVQMCSYDEYVRPLPDMTVMVLSDVDGGRSTGVLQLPVDGVMQWVDHLLGGPGLPVKGVERELTEIEWTLVRGVLRHAMGDLTYAFASVCPLELSVRGVQYNPQFVQAAAASDPVIVATFSLDVAGRTSTATLMVPAPVLLQAMQSGEKLETRSADAIREQELAHERMAEQVRSVPVGVSVRLKPLTVTPRTVAGLAVGDVLTLNHRAHEPLDVVVDDVVLARAALGSAGSRLACLVVSPEENS